MKDFSSILPTKDFCFCTYTCILNYTLNLFVPTVIDFMLKSLMIVFFSVKCLYDILGEKKKKDTQNSRTMPKLN